MAATAGDNSTSAAIHPAQRSILTRKPLKDHSTLEVVPDFGKQVVPDHEKQVVPNRQNWNGQLAYTNWDEDAPESEYPKEYLEPYTHPRKSRKKWIVIGGAVLLIVILVAVLGGVLGSRSKSKPRVPPWTSNIAAVSFTSDNINRTKVYYQDVTGELMEAADSADGTWTNTQLGFAAMSGSPLAAAVSRYAPLEISVFYTDANYILHDVTYNSSINKWAEGVISERNYVTGPNTSIAAMYHQCSLCSNTIVATFQDMNSFVQFANLTTSGWELTQLNVDPIANTGLALQPFPRTGIEDQINLYHQKSNLNLSLATWSPAAVNEGVSSWIPTSQIYDSAPPGTPLAVASSPSTFPDENGYELWIELLSLSSRGIEVDTWSGAINDWLQHENQPSVMANSTQVKQKYGSIAMTAVGRAFAVVMANVTEIQSWQVSDDMVNWKATGAVDIKTGRV